MRAVTVIDDKLKEDAMGGVSAPAATLNNTPGVGNATPPATANLNTDGPSGSGDKYDNDDMYDQNGKLKKKKKVQENNLNPYDKRKIVREYINKNELFKNL